MLKNLDPSLNADVLHALMSMGHADTLVVADANFPSASIAKHTILGRPLAMENLTAAHAVRAILSLLPLDTTVQPSVGRMEVSGYPEELPAVQIEVQAEVDRVEGQHSPLYGIERFAFYEQARRAYCVIRTGESRFYGCFLLHKGVVAPANG